MTKSGSSVAHVITEEDALRVHYYRFLGRLLAMPADRDVLAVAAGLEGDDTDMGQALGALAAIARGVTPSDVKDEYNALFIGLGRGELIPFASYYLTGFLHEKPLAKLRADMDLRGIARANNVKEPEDHIAAVCEMMAGLIGGDFGAPVDLYGQRDFFVTHLSPWAGRFFEDLEAAEMARFYMPVGTIGRVFMNIEATAFEMVS
ncbi:MAG: molecular chaperone TorD family protein [Alphaproteobacteria bacterium]|nr:molecular chaperone TorD family protein [Alphaproteobacteria bacterium]